MTNYLDFEKGLAELQGKAEELRAMARQDPNMDVSSEAEGLESRASEMLSARASARLRAAPRSTMLPSSTR